MAVGRLEWRMLGERCLLLHHMHGMAGGLFECRADATFSSTTTVVAPSKNGEASVVSITKSSRVTAAPPEEQSAGLRGGPASHPHGVLLPFVFQSASVCPTAHLC